MLNLLVFAPIVALAAAKPDYNPTDAAQGGRAYGVGPNGYPNTHLEREITYHRTEIFSKQVRGRAPHSTTNLGDDPSKLLENAVPHSVKHTHFVEEGVVSSPVGFPHPNVPQPEFNLRSPDLQQPQQQGAGGFGGGSGGGFSGGGSGGGGGGFGGRGGGRRRTQAEALAEAQARAQAAQEGGFQDLQNQNLEIPQGSGAGGGVSDESPPPQRLEPGILEDSNSYQIPPQPKPYGALADSYYQRYTYT